MIRSGLMKSGQITLPNAPAIPLGRRVAGSLWCRSRLPIWTTRARRPFSVNVTGHGSLDEVDFKVKSVGRIHQPLFAQGDANLRLRKPGRGIISLTLRKMTS